MTKRTKKAIPITPMVAGDPPPPPPQGLNYDKNALASPNPNLPLFGTDPLDLYDSLKHDVFCRRQIVWDIFRQNEDAQSVKSALVGALADSEIMLVSSKPKRNQTRVDEDLATEMTTIINQAMGRRGGMLDFLDGFISCYLGSITGVFIDHVWDGAGRIMEFGVIPEICQRPWYQTESGIVWNSDGTQMPYQYYGPAGIWFKGDGGYYTNIPYPSYYQTAFAARGRGAFMVGRPLTEENLEVLTLGTAINQFMRQSLFGLDASQVILFNGVDVDGLIEQIKRRREARKNRPLDASERGNVLAAIPNTPDKKAEIDSINLRGMPEGVNLLETMDAITVKIAKGYGVKASRLATLNDKARYAGSGTQAAQQESDEWGRAIVQKAILTYYNDVLLAGLPLKAIVVGTDDPKAYARAAYAQQVSQTASQLATVYGTDTEPIKEFLVTSGVMRPSTIGAIAVTTAEKAAPEKKIETDVEACAQDLSDLWMAFVNTDLPLTIDRWGIDDKKLKDSLDDITLMLVAQAIRCIRVAAGGARDYYIKNLERQAKEGITNLVGRPEAWTPSNRPKLPVFTALIGMNGALAVGAATALDVQQRAMTFTHYIDNYANLSKAAFWYAAGQRNTGEVSWVRTAAESCPDCIQFEGTYTDMATLLNRTGGLLPGSPALADKGHCKCYLSFGGSI